MHFELEHERDRDESTRAAAFRTGVRAHEPDDIGGEATATYGHFPARPSLASAVFLVVSIVLRARKRIRPYDLYAAPHR
jgi:hypothetical protein